MITHCTGIRYVRERYHVPAKRGMRVRSDRGAHLVGRILSAKDGKLHVETDDGEQVWLHPTDRVTYLTDDCPVCRGKGTIDTFTDGWDLCPVCDGEGLIGPYFG